MKSQFAFLPLLVFSVILIAVPAMADSYNNGPVNGNTTAWPIISPGVIPSDSFTLTAGGTVNSFSMWDWLLPGDSLTSVRLTIGTAPYDTSLFDGTLSSSLASNCFTNILGYDVCDETFTFTGPNLGPGNYWLTVWNAQTQDQLPAYWDENSGIGCTSPGCPSTAWLGTFGTIPSEAFTISTSPGPGTPEPSNIMLFGSAILCVAEVLRRKLY